MVNSVTLYAGLNVVLVAAAAGLLVLRAREAPQQHAWSALLCALGCGLATVTYRILPSDLVWAWTTTLREGSSVVAGNLVMGHLAELGANSLALSHLAGAGFTPPLEGLLRANLALSVFNVFAFSALAHELLKGRIAGLVAGLGLLATPLFLIGATSEVYGPLFFAYLLAAALCVAEVIAPEPSHRGIHLIRRMGALAGLTLCTVLAAQTRSETVIVSLPVLALTAARLHLGADRFTQRANAHERRAVAWLRRAVDRSRVGSLIATLVLLFAIDAAVAMQVTWLHTHQVRGALRAANPFDSSTLDFISVLWPSVSPGLVGLVLFGLFATLRRPIHTAWIGMGTLALFRAYHAAAHSGTAPFEMIRYATLMSPLFALLALFGWREVQRRWPNQGVHRSGRLLLATGLLVGAVAAPPRFNSVQLGRNFEFREWADSAAVRAVVARQSPALASANDADVRVIATNAGWLSMESQRQVRFLAAAIRWRPDCRILMPLVEGSGPRAAGRHKREAAGFLVIGPVHRGTTFPQTDLRSLRRAAPELFDGCVWLHAGLDCSEVTSGACPHDIPRHLKVVARSDFAYEGYSEPSEHGVFLSAIGLRLYDLTRAGPDNPL